MSRSPERWSSLEIDRVACTGPGVCARVLPESIALDEWGYPVVDSGPVDPRSGPVRSAIRLCPAAALRVTSRPAERKRPGPDTAASRLEARLRARHEAAD